MLRPGAKRKVAPGTARSTKHLAPHSAPSTKHGRSLYTSVVRFAPEYIAYVLNENFEDAKRLFLAPLMAIHYAHLVMLADRAIIGPFDARRLREGSTASRSKK